jgi:hypothetical protein
MEEKMLNKQAKAVQASELNSAAMNLEIWENLIAWDTTRVDCVLEEQRAKAKEYYSALLLKFAGA